MSQERQFDELRERLDQFRLGQFRLGYDLVGGDRKIKQLIEENLELNLRLGPLVRLLIAKEVISAEEYAGLIAQTRPKE